MTTRPQPAQRRRATNEHPTVWRCAWCSRDRGGRRRAPADVETTGICEPCLGKRRARGYTERGAAFVVWELDRAEARGWADELRSVTGEAPLDK